MLPHQEKERAVEIMDRAAAAFRAYRAYSGQQRAALLEAIGQALEDSSPQLISIAGGESHLPELRLRAELSRTIYQLNMFADLLKAGSWVQATIDIALPDRKPQPRADIRKMLQPIGPVVVFGASNFPFAFSTLGGDTASALAAGCPVVVKAHPAHPETSKAAFQAAQKAIRNAGFPGDILQHEENSSASMGLHLVEADKTAAVGFTGSFTAGRALMEAAQRRARPIQVFAEMSSTNPVVIFPEILASKPEDLAQKLAASVCQGTGQFCTNPGLIFLPKSSGLERFLAAFKTAISQGAITPMLHPGITAAYHNNLEIILAQAGVEKLAEADLLPDENTELLGRPTLATVTADTFVHNKALQQEVFGPFSLLIVAENMAEILLALQELEGQLTSTIFALPSETEAVRPFMTTQLDLCGRMILNDVPTGVEVCAAMVHGGPFPGTSNAQYTSVGTSAIERWVRPVCYQGFPDGLLPPELQNANPLSIMRLRGNTWSSDFI